MQFDIIRIIFAYQTNLNISRTKQGNEVLEKSILKDLAYTLCLKFLLLFNKFFYSFSYLPQGTIIYHRAQTNFSKTQAQISQPPSLTSEPKTTTLRNIKQNKFRIGSSPYKLSIRAIEDTDVMCNVVMFRFYCKIITMMILHVKL